MSRDDSRPLTGDEPIEMMTVKKVIDDYDKRNIGIIHGTRFTWVHGYQVTHPAPGPDGATIPSSVYLTDCYGDEIPGSYGARDAEVRVIVTEPSWTISRVAEYLGYSGPSATGSARKQLSRWGVSAVGRAPGRGGEALYRADQIQAAQSARPGKGRHGAPRDGGRFA